MKQLLKGDILKRYQAYRIALQSRFMQPNEVRYEEDFEPYEYDFITLGLSDVLLDLKNKTIYTPNTNQTVKFGEAAVQKSIDNQTSNAIIEDRYNDGSNYTKDEHGRFTGTGGGSGGGSSGGGAIQSVAISGALNPNSREAQEHADRYCEAVRHIKSDVGRIAKNTGFSEDEIAQVKDFAFMQKHDLGGSELDYFYLNYEMSQSWQRLIDGKNIQSHDLTLLRHELMESNLVKQGYSQDKAHKITEQTYNYGKESKKYHAEISKHNKKS